MAKANGNRIVQPGVLNLNFKHHDFPLAHPQTVSFPSPDGVQVHTIGGLHPYIWMCGMVAAGGEHDAETITERAGKIFDFAKAYMLKRQTPQSSPIVGAEAATDAPAEPEQAEEEAKSPIITE